MTPTRRAVSAARLAESWDVVLRRELDIVLCHRLEAGGEDLARDDRLARTHVAQDERTRDPGDDIDSLGSYRLL